MNKLEQAARQALGALVRAEAMYGQPNADIQTALREALAEQAEQEPVVIGSVLQKVMARLADLLDEDQFNNINSIVEGAGYAAPPRTKDLADDEIDKLHSLDKFWDDHADDIFRYMDFARAIIADDREKNNANNNT